MSVTGRLAAAAVLREVGDAAAADRALADTAAFALAGPRELHTWHHGQGHTESDRTAARDAVLPAVAAAQRAAGDSAGAARTLAGMTEAGAARARAATTRPSARDVPAGVAGGRPGATRPTTAPVTTNPAVASRPMPTTRPAVLGLARRAASPAWDFDAMRRADELARSGDPADVVRLVGTLDPSVRPAAAARLGYLLTCRADGKQAAAQLAAIAGAPAATAPGGAVESLYGDRPTHDYDLILRARTAGGTAAALAAATARVRLVVAAAGAPIPRRTDPDAAATPVSSPSDLALVMALAGADDKQLAWIDSLPPALRRHVWTASAEGFLERFSGVPAELRRFTGRQSGF